VVHYQCSRQQEGAGGLIHGDSFAAILRCTCRSTVILHKLWSGIPWETSVMSPGHKPTSPFPYLRRVHSPHARNISRRTTQCPPMLGSCYSVTADIIRNYLKKGANWPPLWSSGQSSWLQNRRPRFDSWHYQKEKNSGSGTGSTQPREYNWGATSEKSSGSGLENWEHGRRDPSRWPRDTL
jgi:hypothetical protein